MSTAFLRVLPDFLVIGAMRCGTSTIHGYLAQHPSIVLAAYRKEVHYFDWNYGRGEAWYRIHFPAVLRARRAARGGGPILAGEVTPSYLFHPAVPGRVAGLLPGARFVVLLRDPVDRAYSHYQKSVRDGRESLPFDDALEREEERLAADPDFGGAAWTHFSYQARGRYAEQIRRWFALFPRERFLFLQSGEMFRDPAAVCDRVFRFLGLPSVDIVPEHRNAGVYEAMRPETRSRLAAAFRPHNEALYELLGTDFGW